MKPVRWGVLGAASIALRKAVPGMQKSAFIDVVAIASRDESKARAAADELGVIRAYGSYEALLADPEIEAIYIPLPNHLHVSWTIKAMEAGKHVLCEKPIALNAEEARTLLAVRDRTGAKIGEAFMIRSHPQWLGAKALIESGRIGELRSITGHFSYINADPANVRNVREWGGGGLLDIGCYPITLSRWLFGSEPEAVVAMIERDPRSGIDRLATAIMRFPNGQASFTVGTQLVPFQTMQLFGTRGRIGVELPFNAFPDRPTRLRIDDGSDFAGRSEEHIEFAAVDQYALQGEQFSLAVRGAGPVPVPLEDAIANMEVIDALFRSATSGRWETVTNGETNGR